MESRGGGGDPDRWGPVDQLGLVEGYSYWSSACVGQWRREDRVLEERKSKNRDRPEPEGLPAWIPTNNGRVSRGWEENGLKHGSDKCPGIRGQLQQAGRVDLKAGVPGGGRQGDRRSGSSIGRKYENDLH